MAEGKERSSLDLGRFFVVSGHTQLLELFEDATWHFDFLFDAVDQNCRSVQVVLEGTTSAILGVRHIVPIASDFRIVAKFDFHKAMILPQE